MANQLVQQIQTFGHHLEQFESSDALRSILEAQKQIFYEIERQVGSKVDRVEFSQIIENKANQLDLQVVAREMMKLGGAHGTEKSQKLQNILSESLFLGQSSYEDELEHLEQFERQEMSQRRNELQSKEKENKRQDNSSNIEQIQVLDQQLEPEAPLKANLNFQTPESASKADQADLNIHEISSINENDMNLNQSVLRDALQNHNILGNQTPNSKDQNKNLESKASAT